MNKSFVASAGLYILAAMFLFAGSATAAVDLVGCDDDATCDIKVYRSDQPILLNGYTVYLATEKIESNQVAEIYYDGTSNSITCDGEWKNLSSASGRSDLQNQIRCSVENNGSRILADFTLWDQTTYDYPFVNEPGESGYPILSGTSESAPNCQSEDSIATACVWQVEDGDQWLVFAKTTVTGMYLGSAVPEGDDDTESVPENMCMDDMNNDGSLSYEELSPCYDGIDGALCLLDAVKCTETTSTPICPDNNAGESGYLNTDTNLCEDTPIVACADPEAVWDEGLQKCIVLDDCYDICPTGYSYDSISGKCVGSPCPDVATYNKNLNRCEIIISYSCPATDAVYSDQATCNSNCVLEGVCSQGTGVIYKTCWQPYYNSYGSKKEITCPNCDGHELVSGSSWFRVWDYKLTSAGRAEGLTSAPYTNCGYENFSTKKWTQYAWATHKVGPGFNENFWFRKYNNASGYICSTTGDLYQDSTSGSFTIDGKLLCDLLCPADTTACTSSCPTDYTEVSGSNICIGSPGCSYGGTMNADGECVLEPNYDSLGCLVDPDQQCAAGYTYNPDTALCEAYPVCESGAYRSDTDDCYEGDNTCPYGPEWPCMSYKDSSYCSQNVCVPTDGNVTELGDPEGANDKEDDGEVDEDGECLGQLYIFNGKDRRCRNWGLTLAFANCCADDEYLFGLNQCLGEEISLALLKGKGVCHKVGEYCSKEMSLGFTDICIEESDSYCCFGSMLARIIHEQGRSQMQDFDGWGSPESPICRGFTPEEFQMLDFSKIDLDEWIGEIEVTSQSNIESDITQGIESYFE